MLNSQKLFIYVYIYVCYSDFTWQNQSWLFIGSTDAEVEVPILWPPDAKNWLAGKDPDAAERLKAGGEGDYRG